jgi:hypothetical protein
MRNFAASGKQKRHMRVGLVLVFALLAGGCQTFESGCCTDIQIRNDTRQAVLVKDCFTGTCDRFRYSKVLPPGATAAGTDQGDGTTWWLVLSRSGKRLGCLTLGISKRVENYVLRVSTITRCPPLRGHS